MFSTIFYKKSAPLTANSEEDSTNNCNQEQNQQPIMADNKKEEDSSCAQSRNKIGIEKNDIDVDTEEETVTNNAVSTSKLDDLDGNEINNYDNNNGVNNDEAVGTAVQSSTGSIENEDNNMKDERLNDSGSTKAKNKAVQEEPLGTQDRNMATNNIDNTNTAQEEVTVIVSSHQGDNISEASTSTKTGEFTKQTRRSSPRNKKQVVRLSYVDTVKTKRPVEKKPTIKKEEMDLLERLSLPSTPEEIIALPQTQQEKEATNRSRKLNGKESFLFKVTLDLKRLLSPQQRNDATSSMLSMRKDNFDVAKLSEYTWLYLPDDLKIAWNDRAKRIHELHEIDKEEDDWKQMLSELRDYAAEHGHFNVKKDQNLQLHKWIWVVRQKHSKGSLCTEQVMSLEKLGFPWKRKKHHQKQNDDTNDMIDNVLVHDPKPMLNSEIEMEREVEKINGATSVHESDPSTMENTVNETSIDVSSRKSLLVFQNNNCQTQKKYYERENIWNQNLIELTNFKNVHGHINVTWQDNKPLKQWLGNVKRTHKLYNSLSQEFINALEKLGFMLNSASSIESKYDSANTDRDSNLQKEFKQIETLDGEDMHEADATTKAFDVIEEVQGKVLQERQKNDNNNNNMIADSFSDDSKPVSNSHPTIHVTEHLVHQAMIDGSSNKPLQINRGNLEDAKNKWRYKQMEKKWNQMLTELTEFKNAHGHVNVTFTNNKPLKQWLANVKKKHKHNLLSQEFIDALEKLGFTLNSASSVESKHTSGTKLQYTSDNSERDANNGSFSDDNNISKRKSSRKRQKVVSYNELEDFSNFDESDEESDVMGFRNMNDPKTKIHTDKLDKVLLDAVECTEKTSPLDKSINSGNDDQIGDRRSRKRKIQDSLAINENYQNNTESDYECHSSTIPLSKLDPVDQVPQLPSTEFCTWSFDYKCRVLLASFHIKDGNVVVCKEDEEFLLRMMERDDLTVISENLAFGLNKKLWSLEYMKQFVGSMYHHKMRRFDRQLKKQAEGHCSSSDIQEVDGFLSMKIADYVNYLEKRFSIGDEEDSRNFSFCRFNHEKETIIDVDKTCLYMIDFDIPKFLPQWHENFKKTFKMKNLLPGGSHCMMSSVNSSGRPFMGPNLYITPPTAFTHFHQDGYGTVDSGHLCISGYNEVVMLRRLDKYHKENALTLLNCDKYDYDGMYGLPHTDGKKPSWPTNDAIDKCRRMNYYPSVFILKPGQWVHINKGRLHAFRKMEATLLPTEDCHSQLRLDIIKKEKLSRFDACMSVAWDWMFQGVSIKGMNDELQYTLNCASLARENGLQSLAIPETATFALAKSLLAEYEANKDTKHIAASCVTNDKQISYPTNFEKLQGLEKSLKDIVLRHEQAYERIKGALDSRLLSDTPNSWQNPDLFSLDPFGSSDYFCHLCFQELSNLYMHCEGCERLLNRDFNICTDCYISDKHRCTRQMHPLENKKHATLNHTGNNKFTRSSRCICKNGPACKICHLCLGCSCVCHQKFSVNFRFMTIEEEKNLAKKIEDIIYSNDAAEHIRGCDKSINSDLIGVVRNDESLLIQDHVFNNGTNKGCIEYNGASALNIEQIMDTKDSSTDVDTNEVKGYDSINLDSNIVDKVEVTMGGSTNSQHQTELTRELEVSEESKEAKIQDKETSEIFVDLDTAPGQSEYEDKNTSLVMDETIPNSDNGLFSVSMR